MPSFQFPTKERLKSKKHIALLFKSGQTLAAFPVLGIYHIQGKDDALFDDASQLKVAFTVPKKHFKKAVIRNLIKRRMTEAWRLHKSSYIDFLQESNLSTQIMIIYFGKETLPYKNIEKGIKKLLRKLPKQIPN